MYSLLNFSLSVSGKAVAAALATLSKSELAVTIRNEDVAKDYTKTLSLSNGLLQAWHFYHNTSVEYTVNVVPPSGYKMVLLNYGLGDFLTKMRFTVSNDEGTKDALILLVKA